MAKGDITIGIASDTQAFASGVKSGVIRPIEDAEDALKKLGNTNATDDLERGMRDAQRETKEAKSELDKLDDKLRTLDRSSKSSHGGKDFGDDYKRGFKEAGEGASEFKDEANSTAREAAASFDGSAQSVGDAFQEVAANAFAGFGPAGAVAGIAVAAGLGTAITAMQNAGEDADAVKEKVKGIADGLISEFLDSSDAINDLDKRLRDFAENSDKYGLSIADLSRDATKTGASLEKLAQSITGKSVSAAKEGIKYTEDYIDKLREQEQEARTGSTGQTALSKKYGEKADVLQNDVLPALQANKKANEDAKLTEEALAASQGLTVKQYRAEAKAAADAKDATDSFADSVKSAAADAAESSSEALSNEGENADKYIESQQKKIDAISKFKDNANNVYKDVDDNTRNYLQGQGTSLSDEYATYASATPEQKAKIRESWRTEALIEGNTDDIDSKADAQKDKKVDGPTAKIKGDDSDVDKKTDKKSKEAKDGPTSKIKGDTKDVDKKVDKLSGESHPGPTMKLRADDDAVERAINRYKDRKLSATVVFDADTSRVTRALDRLDGRHISVIVDQKPGRTVA